MMNKRKWILAGVGVGAVVLIGLLANVVGNVGIDLSSVNKDITLRALEPVVPGVPKSIHWRVDESLENRMVMFHLRLISLEQALVSAQLADGSVLMVFPCVERDREGSLIMVDAETGELLAWTPIQLLPPGPDCF